nr:hypothetical protein [Tanacetum cinerariifolium]
MHDQQNTENQEQTAQVPHRQLAPSTQGTMVYVHNPIKVSAHDHARSPEMAGALVQVHSLEMVVPPQVPLAPHQKPTGISMARIQYKQMCRNSKAYKEYYAIATGETTPKPKASVRRTRSSSDTSITPPTAAASPRLATFAK